DGRDHPLRQAKPVLHRLDDLEGCKGNDPIGGENPGDPPALQLGEECTDTRRALCLIRRLVVPGHGDLRRSGYSLLQLAVSRSGNASKRGPTDSMLISPGREGAISRAGPARE